MPWDYDVVVIGGGPGGATASRFCAQAGLKTLLIEKKRLPRYKPCGGCLSLKTVHLLDFDLSPVIENTIYGAKFTYCLKDPFFMKFKEPIAFMVMRDRFDHFLIEKSKEKGTQFIEGERVVRAVEKDDRIEVGLARGEKIYCQYLIGADGSESVVTKVLNFPPMKTNGDGMAIQSEIPFESAIDFPEDHLQFIHLDFGQVPNGYGWVFPKKNGLSIGIGGMFNDGEKINPRQYFNTFVKGLRYLREEKMGKVMGHPLPAFYNEGQKVSQGRFLLVGDAAHLMDPLQGEGIYYAIRSGMLAAEAIIQSKKEGLPPSDFYQAAVQVEIFDNLKWALYFSRFVFRFTKLAYRTLKRYPELENLYLQVLEGKETYQGFVARVKERMKDLLKGRLSEMIKKAMARA